MKRQPTKLRTKNPNAKLISIKDIVVSDDAIVALNLIVKPFLTLLITIHHRVKPLLKQRLSTRNLWKATNQIKLSGFA